MRITLNIERSNSSIRDIALAGLAALAPMLFRSGSAAPPGPCIAQPDHGHGENGNVPPLRGADIVRIHRAAVESCARFVRSCAAALRVDAEHRPAGSAHANTATTQAEMLDSVADMMLPSFGYRPNAGQPMAMDPERSSSAV